MSLNPTFRFIWTFKHVTYELCSLTIAASSMVINLAACEIIFLSFTYEAFLSASFLFSICSPLFMFYTPKEFIFFCQRFIPHKNVITHLFYKWVQKTGGYIIYKSFVITDFQFKMMDFFCRCTSQLYVYIDGYQTVQICKINHNS